MKDSLPQTSSKGGEIMKKAILIVLTTVFVFAFAGAALAVSPTTYDTDTGSSAWTYQDAQDATAKTEGSYKAFDDQTTDMYANPHGGYDTTTNKCKVCHAVHRAEGAYFLMRADTQDDACDYCHIGGSAHSLKVVYDLNDAGKATTNGHTIGASAAIPDSSVDQWLEDVTLSTVNEDGTPLTEVVKVRRYEVAKNKMYRYARHHGQSAVGTGRSGYLRIGPLALRCMNCHQPHNAKNMVWRPTDFNNPTTQIASGYKLLRKMPSGSMAPWASINSYGNVDATHTVSVPESTMTPENTGHDAESGSTNWTDGKNTIYTAYEGVTDPAHMHGADRDPQTVNQYALSPWCADCHNLNIGYWKHLTHEELGYKSHADRTHPAPYTGAYNGPAQCYSCHRNDLPENPTTSAYDATRASCERCHFGTGTYKTYRQSDSANLVASDFPHSGQNNSIKLLGAWLTEADPTKTSNIWKDTIGATANVNASTIDGVCLRCHVGIGTNH